MKINHFGSFLAAPIEDIKKSIKGTLPKSTFTTQKVASLALATFLMIATLSLSYFLGKLLLSKAAVSQKTVSITPSTTKAEKPLEKTAEEKAAEKAQQLKALIQEAHISVNSQLNDVDGNLDVLSTLLDKLKPLKRVKNWDGEKQVKARAALLEYLKGLDSSGIKAKQFLDQIKELLKPQTL